MWSASAELGLRCPLLLYWSLVPHAGQCVMPMACARASTCFLNCLCSLVLVLLIVVFFSLFLFVLVLGGGASQRQRDERLHRPNTTLCSFSSCFSSLSFFCLWSGVCCVVRAQPCEHARSTTRAIVFWVCFLIGVCVVCTCGMQCLLHTTMTVLLPPPHIVRC